MAGLAEKFTSLMARPNEDPNDNAPWYIKYGARVVGIIGAFFCILFGLYNCISILIGNVGCLVSGILQIILGFVVMGVEAPFCCMFIDYVQVVSSKVDQRPLWNRAAGYCVLACVPVFLCPGLASIFACGLVFGCGVLYGMMGLGKKASREEMASRAAVQQQQAANNGNNKTIPSNIKSNLVQNAQPMAVSGAPGFDSNV